MGPSALSSADGRNDASVTRVYLVTENAFVSSFFFFLSAITEF